MALGVAAFVLLGLAYMLAIGLMGR